jgi:Ca2+-transporting ATPase
MADTDESGLLIASAKGAPEAIASLCRLDFATEQRLEQAAQAMAARGMRILGVASAHTTTERAQIDQREHDFELLGLIGLSDPPRWRPGGGRPVPRSRHPHPHDHRRLCGDCQAIGAEAGLADGEVLTGAVVASLSDEELAAQIRTVSICARTMPEKLRSSRRSRRQGK